MKQCSKCHEVKDESEYSKKGLRKDGSQKLQPYCKSCQSLVIKAFYKANCEKIKVEVKLRKKSIVDKIQSQVIDYLKNKCCLHCGESDIRCLEFNHIDPSQKERNISNLITQTNSWKRIVKEIEKCEILCANCHRKVTHQQQNTYKHKFVMGL